jgi:rubrerythrin
MKTAQVKELLLQSLEHERGGIKVYETALQCALNEELAEEWRKYLDETRTHAAKLEEVCQAMKIDEEESSPGREIVKAMGASLVKAMTTALAKGEPEAAQLVACECVVLAETKDHLDWDLLGAVAKEMKGPAAKQLAEAVGEIEDQEDEHLYHTRGWCRELWLKSLGIEAVLPPPDEQKKVKTAIGAARAEQSREEML